MFRNKFQSRKTSDASASKLRLEALEERQLLTAVGLCDVPCGPDPSPIVCAGSPALDESPAINLTSIASNETASTVVTTLEDVVADDGVISLREAISYAETGGTITFDESLLEGDRTITLTGQITIDKSLTIKAPDVGITISGGHTDSKPGSRIFKIADGGSYSKISFTCSNLTLTNGYANEENDENGGAVYVGQYDTVTFTDCNFANNAASGYGGAIYVKADSTLTLDNAIVSGNTAEGKGGGIYAALASTVNLTDVEISGNTANGSGGGVGLEKASLVASNATISGNTTTTGQGGGIYAYSALKRFSAVSVVLSNATISDNTATTGAGGGIYADVHNITLKTVLISGNKAEKQGGGVCAVFQEKETTGGTTKTVTLRNVTVVDNAASSGGGIYANGSVNGYYNNKVTTNLYNTIVVENGGDDVVNGGVNAALNAYYSLSSYTDWKAGSGNIAYDSTAPLFVGSGETPYALADYSQAFNAGSNSYVDTTADVAGNKRVLNEVVDIGAYEYTKPVVTTETDNVSSTNLLVSLREAITYAESGDYDTEILFASGMNGKTINLLNAKQLSISKSLTIDASALADGITISGGHTSSTNGSRIFEIASGTSEERVTVDFKNLTLTKGYTAGAQSALGGAVYVGEYDDVSFEKCNFTSNAAAVTTGVKNGVEGKAGGGAIYVGSNSTLSLTDSTISNNTASAVGKGSSSVIGCYPVYGGGVYAESDTTLNLANVKISGNTASATYASSSKNDCGYDVCAYGGGIYMGAGNLTLTSAEITGNSASTVFTCSGSNYGEPGDKYSRAYGGGVYANGSAALTSATIADNTASASYVVNSEEDSSYADARGGGVYANTDSALTLKNMIVATNAAAGEGAADIAQGAATITAFNSLSSYALEGETNLVYAGGALFENAAKGDYTLARHAQAIDAGNDDYAVGITQDLAGNDRIQGGGIDMGAYESAYTALISLSIEGTAEVGQTLTTNLLPTGATASYQWYRDDAAIDDATESQYAVVLDDYGCKLTVVVIGTDSYSGVLESVATVDRTNVTVEPENFADAFNMIEEGGTIKFAANSEEQIIDVDSTIMIGKSVTIDGSDAKIVFDGGYDFNSAEETGTRIFEVEAEKSLTLKSVTLQNGYASESGGAIYNNGVVTLENVTAKGNVAVKNGGVAFNDAGAGLTVNGGTFTDNSARNGGAFANYATMTISGDVAATISNNTATRFGGACFGCGTLEITGAATFSGNEAGSKGGAIYNDVRKDANGDVASAGSVSITGDSVSFVDNTAIGRGGAIMSYSTLDVAGTTSFVGNDGGEYGGAIDVGQGGVATLGGTLTFGGEGANTANFGGAIFSVGDLTFNDDGVYTFTGNTADSGGAINARGGNLILAGEFNFSSNAANGIYSEDKTGFGGGLAIAASTEITEGTSFNWDDSNSAAYGCCVAIDTEITSALGPDKFSENFGDNDYSAFRVLTANSNALSSIFPSTIDPQAVTATIIVNGVTTTFGKEGVTPNELGLGAGTHETLVRYEDVNGETSVIYTFVLTVEPDASINARETTFANGRGAKFNFNWTKDDGCAVSIWEVSWGDGTTTRSEKLADSWMAAHYYAQDGTFDVSLKVTYLDGTSETFEAFATRTVGSVSKTEAVDAVFADADELFVELDNPLVYGSAFLR